MNHLLDTIQSTNFAKLPKEKVVRIEAVVLNLVKELYAIYEEESQLLPEGVPSVVYGLKGLQELLKCGETKAQAIFNDDRYQSAFLTPKGTRNRPCDVAKLVKLMNDSNL